MSFIGKLGYSLVVALIGLFIVFVGLAILIGCIYALSAIMKKAQARREEKAKAAAPAPAPAPVIVPEPVAEAAAEESGEDEGELIAVITAALMAYSKNSNKAVVVKNIRRQSAWAAAGRADQLTRF